MIFLWVSHLNLSLKILFITKGLLVITLQGFKTIFLIYLSSHNFKFVFKIAMTKLISNELILIISELNYQN